MIAFGVALGGLLVVCAADWFKAPKLSWLGYGMALLSIALI